MATPHTTEHHRPTHPEEMHKHSAPVSPKARLQKTLDILLAVVTLDTLINLGVLLSGLVVMAVSLGWVHGG